MRQRRGAAVLPAILLLGAVESSAQFLGGLANINPQQIASSLTHRSPKDIAADVIGSEHPKKIIEAIADTTPAEAAKAVKEGGAAHVDKAAQTIAQAKQTVADAIQGVGLGNVTQALAGSRPAQPADAPVPEPVAAPTPAPADSPSAPSSPQKASVVDALQTMSDAIQHAGKSLNGTRSGAVHDVLNGTSPLSVTGALQGAVDGKLPETLEQAGKAAKAAIESNPHAEALKKAGQGLADAFHIPSPNLVHEAVQDNHPQAANWLQNAIKHATPEKISHAVRQTSPKVVDAMRRGDPTAILPHSRHSPDDQVMPADGADDQGVSWVTVAAGICLAGACLAGGWHIFTSYKRRDSRSPTLLADAEMATWSRSSGQTRGTAHAEEPLFRQF